LAYVHNVRHLELITFIHIG